MKSPLLEATHIEKFYGTRKVLKDIGFQLFPQETLAIVGESGSGKSTLGRLVLGVESGNGGELLFENIPYSKQDPKRLRLGIQMVFQDPYGSLNPRKRAHEIVSEPLRINTSLSRSLAKEKAIALMHRVGLRSELANQYPHSFSGGQRQRLGIARALILEPKVVICDEPVSALDVSIQAQILNLLLDLQQTLHLSYLFISHDLSVVRHFADRVLVLQKGEIVEANHTKPLFENPKHPYTKELLRSGFLSTDRLPLPKSQPGLAPREL